MIRKLIQRLSLSLHHINLKNPVFPEQKQMKLKDFLLSEDQKIKDWFTKTEPSMIEAIQQAATVTNGILTYIAGPKGQAIEAFVISLIPGSHPWADAAIKIATAMAKDMSVITTPASINGIALRLGAEITAIIHGAKLPTGIDGYIAEFQKIFIG